MVLGYLISPVVQIVDSHGKPIVGAKIYVYKAGTTNTVNTYRDFSNHYNPTPVLTNTLGNCTIIAPDDMVYDIVVKDNRNNLLMSKDNLTVSSGINPDINLRFREGYGIIIRKNGNTVTIAIDTDVVATKDDLATKQDKLTAGDNIEITNDNTVNVVNRKTLYTQWPLKVDRGSSMVKLYLDDEFTNYYEAGTGISIDDHVISCTGDITPYTAGSNVTISDHEISSKDWTNDINNAASTNNWDVTPYTAGTGISIDDHVIGVNLSSNGFAKKYTKSVTIDSNSTSEVTVIFDNISDYKTWVSNGLITSPCNCRITVNAGRARNDVVSLYCEQYWVDSGRTLIFDSIGLRFVNGILECGNYTFPCSNTLFTRPGDWNPGIQLIPRDGASFTVGDVITVELELHAVKLI